VKRGFGRNVPALETQLLQARTDISSNNTYLPSVIFSLRDAAERIVHIFTVVKNRY